MRIDSTGRTVRLSVRELAAFRIGPAAAAHGDGPWRAAVGRDWHESARTGMEGEQPGARFEVPVHAFWRHGDWTFELQGRIDQLLPQGAQGLRIREVKTVRNQLPLESGGLAERFPEAVAQAATYLALGGKMEDFRDHELSAELHFIDIESGAVQTVPLEHGHETAFRRQLDALLPFLEDRRERRLRLRRAEVAPAFTTLREGQRELFERLEAAALRSTVTLLEAPTGFGKTGIVLQHALQRLQDGVFERCLYLSSKATGQLEVIRQVRRMLGGELRFVQMRNRAEHRIESAAHTCGGDHRCDRELTEKWDAAGLHPPDLFAGGTLELERAKSLGRRTGVCPYALTRSALPFAELWIGDTNYVFSPASQSVFFRQPDFDPARTLLIVDEAHNIPDRAADALGVELSATDWLFAVEELRAAGASRRLVAIGRELGARLDALQPGGRIAPEAHYVLLDLCEEFAGHLGRLAIDWDATAPFAPDLAFRIPELARSLAGASHEWFHWSPVAGTLRATCLQPGPWIADCLAPFGGAILMSATLGPTETFRESCGLAAERTTPAPGIAPWRDDAYEVAVDLRVDTRLKHRSRHYETTARTVAALAADTPGSPVAVFFASYQYAENIRAYVETVAPGLRVQVQPRGVDLAAQEAFLEEGLLLADVLFLILGSGYAEGIDTLGGRVGTVLIVGPALPEITPVVEARMEAHPSLNRSTAFRDICIVPAMRRIHQALGRLVRSPGQRARVLLHGRRFGEAAHREQLAPEYRPGAEIRTGEELRQWLNASRSRSRNVEHSDENEAPYGNYG